MNAQTYAEYARMIDFARSPVETSTLERSKTVDRDNTLDAFISYNRRDQLQIEIIARALREKGLDVFFDRWYLAPGTSWAEELEAVLGRVGAAAVFVGPGEMGPWQQREKNFALDRQANEPSFRVIPVLLPGADPALGFLGQNTWVDLRLGIHDTRGIDQLVAAIRGNTVEPDTDAASAICPYRGLLYFREEDAAFFFGREMATSQLLKAVSRREFVAVVGASGSGKSSVVRAGLLPALRRDLETTWEIMTVVPTNRPLFQLARAMIVLLKPDADLLERAARSAKLADDFATGTLGLQDLVLESLEKHRDISRLLIVVDQWEELYTLGDDESVRRRFMDLLLDATEATPCNVVLTLRGDFVGRALAYRRLSDHLQDGQINIGPMTRAELQGAIEYPAQKVGLHFEPGLIERILEDVGDEPGNLPLLEFVLKRLWETRKRHQLQHSSYDAMGQLRGAVATKAEEVFAQLPQIEQDVVQDLFLHLVRPGDGMDDSRRRATLAELGTRYGPLVKKLSDERLLVTGIEDENDDETVEVSHEALIQNWSRLKTWLNEDREFLLWHERLRGQIAAWLESARDEGGLLRGVPLEIAIRWSSQRNERLRPDERDYIGEGVALRDREEQARLSQALRERELEHTRSVAQEQERAAGRLRRHRSALAAAVAAILVLSVALVLNLREQAVTKDRHARAYNLSLAAVSNLPKNPELATLLAVASAEETYAMEGTLIPETVDALNRVLRPPAAIRVADLKGSDLFDLAFRPGTHQIAIAGKEMKIQLWDPVAASNVRVFEPKANWFAVAFSNDGGVMAAGAEDGIIRIWDVENAKLITELHGHAGAVFDVKFGTDSNVLLSAGADHTARLWNVSSGMELTPPLRHSNKVYGVAVASDGNRVATAGADKTVVIWDLRKAQPLRVLTGHLDVVNAVAISPDGKMVASASQDRSIGIWDFETGVLLREFRGHADTVRSVRFSPDGRFLVSTSHDRSICVWDPSTGILLTTLYGPTDSISATSFSADGTLLASVGTDQKARVWETSFLRHLMSGHRAAVNSIAFNREGSRLVSGGFDRTAQLWDLVSGKRPFTLAGHVSTINGVAFSPDGNTVATASDDKTAKLWSVASGAVVRELRGHDAEVVSVAFSPNGRYVATSSKDRTTIVWETTSGNMLRRLLGHTNMVFSVAFSPNGQRIATGSFDGTTKIWDVESGKLILTLARHERAVNAVTFAPETNTLATASWDATVKIWDIYTGILLHTLKGHTDQVTGATFSPDGKILATVSRDESIRLWDVIRGTQVSWYPTNTGAILGVAFSPDGKRVGAAHADGVVRLFDLETLIRPDAEKLMATVKARALRKLTSEECVQYVATAACKLILPSLTLKQNEEHR
jgi:WD40 repeat protein/energy-coupling factor transporter ATP-binding protein EcfA2